MLTTRGGDREAGDSGSPSVGGVAGARNAAGGLVGGALATRTAAPRSFWYTAFPARRPRLVFFFAGDNGNDTMCIPFRKRFLFPLLNHTATHAQTITHTVTQSNPSNATPENSYQNA